MVFRSPLAYSRVPWKLNLCSYFDINALNDKKFL